MSKMEIVSARSVTPGQVDRGDVGSAFSLAERRLSKREEPAAAAKGLPVVYLGYNPAEPRDQNGRWTSGGATYRINDKNKGDIAVRLMNQQIADEKIGPLTDREKSAYKLLRSITSFPTESKESFIRSGVDGRITSGITWSKSEQGHLYINDLASLKAGEGTVWLAKAEARAHELGVKRIKLNALNDAVPFYEKSGFTKFQGENEPFPTMVKFLKDEHKSISPPSPFVVGDVGVLAASPVFLASLFVEVAPAKGYNPAEPRDQDGRWTSGGASRKPAALPGDLPASLAVVGEGKVTPEHLAMVKEATLAALAEMDASPKQKVNFITDPGARISMLDGTTREGATTAAFFRARTGAGTDAGARVFKDGLIGIHVGAMRMSDPESVKNVVRHEMSHAKFHFAARTSARVGTFVEKNMDMLEKEDGTTSYSRAYWERVKKLEANPPSWWSGGKFIDPQARGRAIDESLAEWNSNPQSSARILNTTPTYQKLNALVSTLYRDGTAKERTPPEPKPSPQKSTTPDGKLIIAPGVITLLPGGIEAGVWESSSGQSFIRLVHPNGDVTLATMV